MDLKQLLTMLQSVSGPNASGEYTAKCPAHQDRTASLTATEKESQKDGKRRIYLCCHAGCDGAAIMAALGISAKDLIVNPDEGGSGAKAGRASGKRRNGVGAGNGSAKNGGGGSETAGTVLQSPPAAETDRTVPLSQAPGSGETVGGVTVHTVPAGKLDESGTETYTMANAKEINHGNMTDDITGFWNVAIGGDSTLAKNQNGTRNVAIGNVAMSRLKNGNRNICIGTYAMPYVTSGNQNIAIGADTLYDALWGNQESVANYNVAIGKDTLTNGMLVERNVAIGIEAMQKNDTDSKDNTIIGYRAGRYTSDENTMVGAYSGQLNTGDGNTFVGHRAGSDLYINGNNNVCIGKGAGFSDSSATSSNPATISNSISIGYNVKTTGSNQARFGNTDQTIILAGKKIVFNQDGSVTWEAL